MHFLIAFLLLFVLFAFVGRPDFNRPELRVGELVLFQNGKSPAQLAGFKLGDKIVSVDGKTFSKWDDLPPYIQKNPGKQLNFVVERDGKQLTLPATPVDRSTISVKGEAGVEPSDVNKGFMGIGPAFPVERTGIIGGVGRSVGEVGSQMKQTVVALGRIATFRGLESYTNQFTGTGTGASSNSNGSNDQVRFQSPIGIVRLAGQAADSGLRQVLVLLAAINIFVGVFNMIPLPPFDGGHVAVATYERIRSRKGRRYHADVTKLMPVAYAVVLLLVFISLSSFWLDIVKPASNPFQ